MRLTYAGCNLFGQVPTSRELAIDHFQELPLEDDLIDIALGHSITVYLKKDGLYFHGHGLQPRVTHQITKMDVPTQAKIKLVKTCDTSVLVLDDEGRLFVLDFLAKNPGFTIRLLKRSDAGMIDKVVDFASGSTINVGLTQTGMLYNFPVRLDFRLEENVKVKKMTAGYEHVVILDTAGNVYSFGNGRRGQLGNGILEIQETPRKIQVLEGIFITDVSTGGWHSMALSRDGDVYIWGWNGDGQIGLFDDHNDPLGVVSIPQYLPLPGENLNVAHIAAGGRHSICITSDQIVFAYGCNKFNQLGLPDFEMVVNKPTKVYEISKEKKVLRVEAGPSSTVIITDEA
ncbi:RCC1 domain-containing protein 1 [Atheta coriaria]|uniref:RCC1 domain-containing protein 1 n=1 Tax=Dalotia coriaria TaxID=877792 RepID=UPI0031F437D5